MNRQFLIGLIAISFIVISVPSVYAQTTTSFTISLTGQPNTNTFPYGICYDGTQYVYMTIFASGQLARVDKDTNAVTFFDDNTATSGQDWYSALCHDGKVYVNERDNGKMKVFTVSGSSFTTVPLPQNLDDSELDYIEGYAVSPNKLKAVDSQNTYDFGCNSFGEIKFANSYVWQVFDCVYDFSVTDNANGVVDYSFHGIVRVDPLDNSVTRYAITGASSLRGIDVDSVDSTILWITDISADKIFKFDTSTNTVTQTITLPAGSMARGITDDSTNLYVASNKNGDGVASGKILSVVKSDGTVTTIDTGAVVDNGVAGVFEVDIARGFIMWSDQSRNIGTINLSTVAKTITRTSDASSNHFGVVVGDRYWIAGQGSVVVTQTSFPSGSVDIDSSVGNGDYKHLSRPTMGKSHLTGEQLVDFGFYHNENKYTITDNFYTPTEKIPIITGNPNNFKIKTFVDDAEVMVGEISLVSDVGKFEDAEVRLEAYFNHDNSLKKIKVFQKDIIIDVYSVNAYQESVDCFEDSGRNDCIIIGFDNVIFMEKPIFEKIALNVINDDRRYQVTYLNDGFSFEGIDSFNPPLMIDAVVESGGLQTLVRVDKKSNLWQNEYDIVYWKNDFGTFIRQSPYEMILTPDKPVNVMTRNHSDFGSLKLYEIKKAVSVFDSKLIQKSDKGFFSYPEGIDHRKQTLQKLGWLD